MTRPLEEMREILDKYVGANNIHGLSSTQEGIYVYHEFDVPFVVRKRAPTTLNSNLNTN